MSHLLIVEPKTAQAEVLKRHLVAGGFCPAHVKSSRQALAALQDRKYDAALLSMPLSRDSGLDLIDAIRQSNPRLPVVVVVQDGHDESAAEAVRRGAVSYVFERRIDRDICPMLSQVLGLSSAKTRKRRVPDSWSETTARFVLGNDVELVPAFVAHISDTLRLLCFGDENVRIRVAVALTEAVTNGILHGNLELDSDLRDGDGRAWDVECRRRRATPPYQDRRLIVDCRMTPEAVEFCIRDEGPGFNPATVPDPRSAQGVDRISGRGVLLMRTFMHEVRYSPRGNEVTLLRRATG